MRRINLMRLFRSVFDVEYVIITDDLLEKLDFVKFEFWENVL